MLDSFMRLIGLKKEWPVYTLDEVREHNSRFSAWLVKGNSVYDVTSILETHPGGADALLRRSGGVKDSTEDYYFHSRAARKAWASFKIGELSSSETSGKKVQDACMLDSVNGDFTPDASPLNHVGPREECTCSRDCTCTVKTQGSFSEPVPERICSDCLHRQLGRRVFRQLL